MKWAGMYFVGFVILIGGILAALWKLGRSAAHRDDLDSDRRRDPDRHGDHDLGRQQRDQGKYPDRPEISGKQLVTPAASQPCLASMAVRRQRA